MPKTEKYSMNAEDSSSYREIRTVPLWWLIVAVVAGVILCIIIGLAVGLGSPGTGCSSNKVQTMTSASSTSVAPLVTTTGMPIPMSAYRLPTSLYPTTYKLSMQVFLPSPKVPLTSIPKLQQFTFNANLTIFMNCTQNTNNITMHMNRINLTANSFLLQEVFPNGNLSALLNLTTGNGNGYIYNSQVQMVTWTLATGMLQQGHTYRLQMQYIGLLTDDLVGFYRSSYMEEGISRWMGITQFEPTDARRALPCFDEPAFKAVFHVTIIHPVDLIALSNGMERPSIQFAQNWNSTSFEPTLKMSSYLLAFAVMDFQSTSAYTKDNKTLFRIWSRPSLLDQTEYATRVGPQVLDLYSAYFNVSFPLAKQDMVAVPDFDAGAMENWGLVTYRESRILYKSNYSYRPRTKESVTDVIAHELAHQWFGDLVTTSWWNDLFLNEGFADYIEYIGTDGIPAINFTYQMDNQFEDLDTVPAMARDQLLSSHPISYNVVGTADSINQLFDTITYEKAGAILKMLNFTITKPIFLKGLEMYLKKYSYGNADHYQLWALLQNIVTAKATIRDWNGQILNISTFLNPWIEQMGYPAIKAMRNYTNNQIALTQMRFLGSKNATQNNWTPSPFNYTWYVPIWYQNAANDIIRFAWNIPNKPTIITGPSSVNQWYIMNSGVRGFYRVNYDLKNWNLLTQQLVQEPTTLQVRNRGQLLDDAFNLAKAGQLPYGTALNLSLYLTKERSYIVWDSASSTFGFLNNMFVLDTNFPYLRNYMLKILTPVYQYYGWNDNAVPENNVLNHEMRYYAIRTACQLQLTHCVTNALSKFNQFKVACNNSGNGTSPCNPLAATVRSAVYCAGIIYGTINDWSMLWRYYASEQISVEKDALLYGLSCTREPYLLKKLLTAGLQASTPNSPIRKQDARYVFSYVGGNPVGRQLMWSYIRSNWNQLYNAYESSIFGLTRIAETATKSFNSDYDINQLKNFIATHTLGSASSSFQRQLETAMENRDWMNNYSATVVNWLKAQPPSSDDTF